MNVFLSAAQRQQRLHQLNLVGKRFWQSLPDPGLAAAVFGLALLAVFVGMVVALGSMEFTVVLAGVLVLVPVIFFVNIGSMLPLLFLLVFVLQGPAVSFLHMRLATWIASGFSALFFAKVVLGLVSRNGWRPTVHSPPRGAYAVLLAAYLYLSFFFFSLAMGHATPPQMISAVRFCLPMFGVLFALHWFPWGEQRLLTLWKLVIIITILQVPLVVYQHFFRIDVEGWDAVVGTFGFGMSPILVLFTLAAFLYCLASWSRGLMPVWLVALVFVATMAIILLGEVKAVVLWVPLGVFVVMRRRILKNPLVFVTYGIFLMLFIAGTFFVYKALYWGNEQGGGDSIEEKYNNTSGYVFDPHSINYRTGEVSRGASLALWYRDPIPSMVERLVGYGPGASFTSPSTGQGVVAARYRTLQLGATALAQLLWDVGILGTLAYVSIFIGGIMAGLRFGRRSDVPPVQMAIVDTSLAVLVLLATTLIYNRTVLDEPTVQLLLFFVLGCILQFTRFGQPAVAAPVTSQGAPLSLRGVR